VSLNEPLNWQAPGSSWLGCLLPLSFASIGCLEYNPRGHTDEVPDGNEDTDVVPRLDDDCDGVDDDGDAQADEDAPDLDQDDLPDCEQCGVRPADPLAVSDATACSPPSPSARPWDVELLWTAEAGDGYGCRVTSVADLDEDGDAEVLCASQQFVRALDGSTGAELWKSDEMPWLSGTAVLDVDGDGLIDVVGLDKDGRAVVLDRDGNLRRRSNEAIAPDPWGYGGISRTGIAVFSDGGVPAIATPEAAVRASGGDNLGVFERPWDDEIALLDHAVADLDLDGVAEILTKAGAFSPEGTVLWSTDPPGDPFRSQFPVILQADDDPEGEVLWLSGLDGVQLTDADGTELAWTAMPDPDLNAAMGCVGDLDGDGRSEVVFSDHEYAYAWTPFGAELWRTPIVDVTGSVTCSTFDFDGDGAKEVVIGTEDTVYILDGASGASLWDTVRSSNTGKDLPMLADVDGDGSADIVMSNPSGGTDVRDGADVAVFSNKNRDWPPGLPYWPYESWSGVGLWPDGTLRDDQAPPWLEYNIWRGQPEWVLWGTDLRAEIVDSCVAESPSDDAEVRLSVRLANLGPQAAPAGTPVAVYRVKANGSRVLREVLTTTEPLEAGYATATWEIVSTRSEAEHGFAFVAGHDGTDTTYKHDCDEANNEALWTLP
jgi:outer membrane protein assembly factor BamB